MSEPAASIGSEPVSAYHTLAQAPPRSRCNRVCLVSFAAIPIIVAAAGTLIASVSFNDNPNAKWGGALIGAFLGVVVGKVVHHRLTRPPLPDAQVN